MDLLEAVIAGNIEKISAVLEGRTVQATWTEPVCLVSPACAPAARVSHDACELRCLWRAKWKLRVLGRRVSSLVRRTGQR